SGVAEQAQRSAIETAAEQVQRSLDFVRGPLLRMGCFELGGGRPGRLLAVVHHLAVDGVSWRILLEDLESAYVQLSRGEAVRLPAKTTAWQTWATRMAEHAHGAALEDEAAYWRAQAAREVTPLPLDCSEGEDTLSRSRHVAVRLDREETEALLREVPQAYRTQIDDVLLTALAGALRRWTGERRVRVELEGHGREEERVPGADLSRTVGWFTSIYPVVLELPENGGAGAALRAVKEQLREVPGRGIGYGLLRHLRGMDLGPGAELGFNYLGQLDQTVSGEAFFALAEESAGGTQDGRTPRAHRVEVTGAVREGRLEVAIGYGAAVHHRQTMERLAALYAEELRGLIAHCTSDGAGGYTPSDFPLAGLGQEELDTLLGRGREVEDVYPLVPMQEGMLFHALSSPESGAYLGQFGFVLEGDLDSEALERAWQGGVARHEALRAGFVWEELRRPLQVVRRMVEVPFRREDWRGLGEAERQARMQAYLREDRLQGFDLTWAPLMRLALFRTAESRYQLVWTHHHLILDGWSLGVLFRDVLALYAAYREGRTAQPRKARPYGEYVAWLAGQDFARSEQVWREELEGFAAPTPLPLDEAAPRGSGEAGHGEAELRLGEERVAALQAFARAQGLTLNTLLQGAWALLLARYSGEEEVVFGATVSGRPPHLPGMEEMVGVFINTLPVRVRVRPEARVGEWLAKLQARQAALQEHEHTPLVQVQKWSGVPAGRPLFESVFSFANYPFDPAHGAQDPGFRVASSWAIERDDYPLFLVAEAQGGGIRGKLVYHTPRFSPAAAERLLELLGGLLGELAADPARRLGDVSGLAPEERQRLLAAGWGAREEYPWERCVDERIADRAAATPDAVAVMCGDDRIGYGELGERASRLADRLRLLGVGPEVRVALLLDRSVELAVAILGVLRAGGAYVPLDPAYPRERLAYLLADSGARVVVTRNSLADTLPAGTARTLLVDDAGLTAAEPVGLRRADPDRLAYVVYTSGSTGTP
ncbi:MAG TPA: condensation domain-containing protein, partial [Longimicrobiaceae bacterium]|nr:condensation domain-containing protein [Longimicrobiaceae bacterium]